MAQKNSYSNNKPEKHLEVFILDTPIHQFTIIIPPFHHSWI